MFPENDTFLLKDLRIKKNGRFKVEQKHHHRCQPVQMGTFDQLLGCSAEKPEAKGSS